MAQSCSTCKYFLPQDPETGLCRRIPAVPLSFGVAQNGQPLVLTFFPAMKPDGWCGEFKLRLEGLN